MHVANVGSYFMQSSYTRIWKQYDSQSIVVLPVDLQYLLPDIILSYTQRILSSTAALSFLEGACVLVGKSLPFKRAWLIWLRIRADLKAYTSPQMYCPRRWPYCWFDCLSWELTRQSFRITVDLPRCNSFIRE